MSLRGIFLILILLAGVYNNCGEQPPWAGKLKSGANQNSEGQFQEGWLSLTRTISLAPIGRNSVAFDSVNQVYLVLTPSGGQFVDALGNQIGSSFPIASEIASGCANRGTVTFGGPASDPAFLVTYVVDDLALNPKYGRLVRYRGGSAPLVSDRSKIADVSGAWYASEKSQTIWNGQKFIVGSKVMHSTSGMPTSQVNFFSMDGSVSAPVTLGDGSAHHAAPAIACSPSVCLAIGFAAAGDSSGGGTYARFFNPLTLQTQGSLFNIDWENGTKRDEDQAVIYNPQSNQFIAAWASRGYAEYKLVSPSGTVGPLMQFGAGTSADLSLSYNSKTQTTLLVVKYAAPADYANPARWYELYALELDSQGFLLHPENIIQVIWWDGNLATVYNNAVAADPINGRWLIMAQNAGGQGALVQNTPF